MVIRTEACLTPLDLTSSQMSPVLDNQFVVKHFIIEYIFWPVKIVPRVHWCNPGCMIERLRELILRTSFH